MDKSMSSVVHIEVLLDENCLMSHNDIQVLLHTELLKYQTLQSDKTLSEFEDQSLQATVISVSISFPEDRKGKSVLLKDAYHVYHIYCVHLDGPSAFELGGDNEGVNAATHWMLPSKQFHGLWENLVFDSEIKTQLLSYISSTLLFSERKVDWNIVPWNKVVLLHGPPGTGKTSLCKALAQKICIRFSKKYSTGFLFEINSHSLFSKWFSESGKLVANLFSRIEEIILNTDSLVIILIDEVESLAHSRKAAFMGNSEPSDSIRVVNALLTHLDHIRRFPNVLILTTSNITEAIDIALVDRADIKQYIGLPSSLAIYQIYCSCINELQRTGIVYATETVLSLSEMNDVKELNMHSANIECELSRKLMDISRKSVGLSGRTIRKLTLMAHALHVEAPILSLSAYLDALSLTVVDQFKDRQSITELSTKMESLCS